MKYRKKPVIIEAFQCNGSNALEICAWVNKELPPQANVIARMSWSEEILTIRTLEGNMNAGPGDWIIKGVNGEFYPCKPDIFEKTYEPVEDQS